MELSIYKVVDKKIYQKIKKDTYFSLIVFFGCYCIGNVLITYHFLALGVIFLCIFLIGIIVLLIQNLNRVITYEKASLEIVHVDDNQCFLFQNQSFDFHDLKHIGGNRFIFALEFENQIVLVKRQKDLYYYLKTYYASLISPQVTNTGFISSILVGWNIILISIIVMKIIFGFIYCLYTSSTIIDLTRLFADFGTIVLTLGAILLTKIWKKYHLLFYSLSFIGVIGLMTYPLDSITTLYKDNETIGYHQDVKGLTMYRDVAYVFGKELGWVNGTSFSHIGIFYDVAYVKNKGQYLFYNLNPITDTLDDFYQEYDSCSYNAYNVNQLKINIRNKKLQINDNTYLPHMVGNHILYIQVDNPYLIRFQQGKCEVYELNSEKTIVLNQDNSFYFNDEDTTNQEDESVSLNSQEPDEEKRQEVLEPEVDPYYEEIEKEREKRDQENHLAYQKAIKQNDISSFQSNQNVVKIHEESQDIYQVIKALDREYTRINNDKDTILDVQILSMMVYHGYENQYGIYITRRVDSSKAESQTFDEVIVMKKYDHDYIGTRYYNRTYMPKNHLTNNGSYDTRQTTEFLYRIKGNQIVDNAW